MYDSTFPLSGIKFVTFASALALFGAMIVLALVPGPGIVVVVARTLSAGLRHGFSTSAGIVVGDYVFITLALFGLAALASVMGELFTLIRYFGAVYLLYLGIRIALSKPRDVTAVRIDRPSHLASFVTGLVTTLINPKAVLFYLSFFPAFLDLTQVSVLDIWFIYGIATLAMGSVMLGYAILAAKTHHRFSDSSGAVYVRYTSSAMLIGSGIFIFFGG